MLSFLDNTMPKNLSYVLITQSKNQLIMVALCNRADHYILPCGFYLLSFFFPRLISAVGDWMSTVLPHMVWP